MSEDQRDQDEWGRMRQEIAQRLWQIKGNRSIRRFSDEIGVDRETFRRALSGDVYRLELIVRVCEIEDINANWLLFGIGPQHGRDPVAMVLAAVDEKQLATRASKAIMNSVRSGRRGATPAVNRLRLGESPPPRGSLRSSVRPRARR